MDRKLKMGIFMKCEASFSENITANIALFICPFLSMGISKPLFFHTDSRIQQVFHEYDETLIKS